MQPYKNNNDISSGLSDRLAACVERVGGKRALATAALISEAQLFRYLNADTDVPGDRLVAIAKAANVDAGWLLTGNGTVDGGAMDPRPPFRTELMVQVVQMFEELLIESDKKFTPRQKAHAVTLLYEALRIEEQRKGTELTIDKRLAPFYPDYLAPLRSDNRMEDYLNSMHALEYGGDISVQSVKQFDTLVKMGLNSVYEGTVGEVYFDRMGTTLLPEAAQMLLNLVETSYTLTGKKQIDWLDTGCGTGRHLAFLSQHCPNLKLQGFDSSNLALSLCNSLIQSNKLAAGVVQEADLRNMPYPNESVDVIYCRASLHVLPYIAGQNVGANQFIKEVARILRPGGIVHILTPQGLGRDYVNFIQYHTAETLQALAREGGLQVHSLEEASFNETGGTVGKDYSHKLNRAYSVILKK